MPPVAELPTKPKAKEGRPLLFNSPEELEIRANEYFEHCEKNDIKPVLGELAVFLDCDRKTLVNYSNSDEFFPTFRRIKTKCEASLERLLIDKDTYTAGQKFALENGYGWSGNSSVVHSGNIDTPSSVAVIEAMGAFASMLQTSSKAKLIEGEVIDGE